MIEITTEKLSRAITKAKKVRNHVRMIDWRKYEVTTPEQHVYSVTFDVQGSHKMAHCTCAAGAKNLPCYHIAGAVALHCYIARAKAQAEPICEPTPATTRPAPRKQVNLDDNGPLYVPAVLVKPQPPSRGRVGGIEL
jgi:hypothetical protein